MDIGFIDKKIKSVMYHFTLKITINNPVENIQNNINTRKTKR